MKKNKKIGIIIFFAFLTASCESNSIYYDLDSQRLKRCNDKGIRQLEIENDSLKKYYSIDWNSEKEIPNSIDLNAIPNGYRIILNGTSVISNSEFKLFPNTFYNITHGSNGDAGSNEISIFFSNDMKVLRASKTSCD